MSTRHHDIGPRPQLGLPVSPQAQAWVRQGEGSAAQKREIYTARLTIDVTPALRARIKLSAYARGLTAAELLRAVLEREFAQEKP